VEIAKKQMNAQDRANNRTEKKRMEDKRMEEDDEVVLISYTLPRPLQVSES
jgi:hypothetical protein